MCGIIKISCVYSHLFYQLLVRYFMSNILFTGYDRTKGSILSRVYVLGVYLTDVCSITLSILKIYFLDVNLIKTSVIQSLLYNLIKISVIQFYPLKNNLSKNFLSKIYLSETYNYLSIVNLLKNLCAKIQKISYIKSSTSYPTVFLFISQILEIKLLKINVFIFYVPRLNLYFFKFSFQENFLKHYTLLQKLLSSNNLIFYHGS